MPRRVNRRRLVVAAVLVALAVLPNAIHVYGALHYPASYPPTDERERPVVQVMSLGRSLFLVDVQSVDRAKAVGYRWEQYRRCWWVLAAIAGCVIVRELLPIPRLFGPDDDETL